MKVSHLLIKPETNSEMVECDLITINNLQIVGQKLSQPLRSVLITSKSLLDYWDIKPGALRENIVVDDINISELQSGDVVQAGGVQIRITFNCEPCGKVVHIANVSEMVKKRGMLGSFLNDGLIHVGDNFSVVEKNKYEQIPDEYYSRIAWYLDKKVVGTIMATDLLWNCGVAPGLIRALSRIMEKHHMQGKDKVIFAKDLQ